MLESATEYSTKLAASGATVVSSVANYLTDWWGGDANPNTNAPAAAPTASGYGTNGHNGASAAPAAQEQAGGNDWSAWGWNAGAKEAPPPATPPPAAAANQNISGNKSADDWSNWDASFGSPASDSTPTATPTTQTPPARTAGGGGGKSYGTGASSAAKPAASAEPFGDWSDWGGGGAGAGGGAPVLTPVKKGD